MPSDIAPAKPPLFLERVDPSLNMARYYRLSLEPSLFGDAALVIEWGRLGTRGRRRLRLFPAMDAAIESWRKIEIAKRRRGYIDG
jgi:predicted DNA-binding WGR domain protein